MTMQVIMVGNEEVPIDVPERHEGSIWAGVPEDIRARVSKVAYEPKKVGGLFSENYIVPWAHMLMQDRATIAARAAAEITRSAAILRPTELAYVIAKLIIDGK